jgi:tripartite-type tricarboxylate transporter receptor subunit TctC
MVTDMIGGQVEMGVLALPAVQAHIKSGALRAIGVRHAGALAGRARDPDDRRAGPAELQRRRLVRGDRPAEDAGRRHQARARRVVAAFNSADVREAMDKQGNTIKP